MSALWDYELPSGVLLQLRVPDLQSIDGAPDHDVVTMPRGTLAATLGLDGALEELERLVDQVVRQAVVQPELLPTPLHFDGSRDESAVDPDALYVHDLSLEDKLLIAKEVDRVNRGRING